MEIFIKAYDIFVTNILEYITSLDWSYIITLMVVVELVSTVVPSDVIFKIKNWDFSIKPPVRVIILGLALAALFAWFNEASSRQDIQNMFQSMIMAFAVYAFALTSFIEKLKAFIQTKKK